MRNAIRGFFNIGRTGTKVSTKVAGVAEKVTVKAGQKLAKKDFWDLYLLLELVLIFGVL